MKTLLLMRAYLIGFLWGYFWLLMVSSFVIGVILVFSCFIQFGTAKHNPSDGLLGLGIVSVGGLLWHVLEYVKKRIGE